MTPRTRLVAGGAGAALLAAVATVATIGLTRGAAPVAGRPADQTTTVTRGTLVEVSTANGALAYGPEQLAESRVAGTVTGLAPLGSTVDRGRPLFRVDDRPVVLFYGTLPAYRALTAGRAATTGATGEEKAVPASQGADVRQFEENLKALGYTGFTVDDQYTGQTATVVRRWQKDLGLPQTGEVELGRVFYAPAAVRVAKHRITLGAVAAGPVLAYTGTARLVTASIKEHEQDIAKVGTKVTVLLPNGKELAGAVAVVATPVDPQANQGQEPTLDVVVTLDNPAEVNGLDDGPARVRFVVQERKDVLMVPVGALLALSEGGYGLEVLDGGASRILAVTTGLFADGNVEVSGPEIQAGLVVGMAR